MKRILSIIIVFCLLLPAYADSQKTPAEEIRAAWLTTNWKLDWPRDAATTTQQQKTELIKILDELEKANFNTVFFQVRSQGATFYNSKIEPRSAYLNGDGFDPLAFAIEEGHKRGLEVHAWLVTIPMGNTNNRQISKTANRAKRPDFFVLYKDHWYMDPGHPSTREYILKLVKELVQNYDIDGIHFDYIRYPDHKFPDINTYKRFGNNEGRNEWRKNNINQIVREVYDLTKSIKNWVQVSSSPLGKYRSLPQKGLNSGWTALESVSQDAVQWMKEGKHDLVFPMLYYKGQQFYPFLQDWIDNSHGRIVVPGIGIYQLSEQSWDVKSIEEQVEYTRKENLAGQAYFRLGNYMDNDKGVKEVVNKFYSHPAKLIPLTWLSEEKPESPTNLQVYKDKDGLLNLKWDAPDNLHAYNYTIYVTKKRDIDTDNPKNIFEIRLKDKSYKFEPAVGEFGYYYTVSATDRYHNESEIAFPAFFSHSENKQ